MIDYNKAWKSLEEFCDAMEMKIAINGDEQYFLKKEGAHFVVKNQFDKKVDDRGDLFAAIRSLIDVAYPAYSQLEEFHNDNYIFNFGKNTPMGLLMDHNDLIDRLHELVNKYC